MDTLEMHCGVTVIIQIDTQIARPSSPRDEFQVSREAERRKPFSEDRDDGKSGGYVRVSQEPAEEILKKVLAFRDSYDQYEKPDDVNFLLSLFPRVRLREGYVLDYVLESAGEAVQHILPYARVEGEEDSLLVMSAAGSSADQVEALYQYLDYERSPQGLFEYVFFVAELWATRASWHAAEWLSSTPIFTETRFTELVDKAKKVDSLSRPDWYGPEAELWEDGGKVRFPVHTEMGWERIYYLEVTVDTRGSTEQVAGAVLADFGTGLLF